MDPNQERLTTEKVHWSKEEFTFEHIYGCSLLEFSPQKSISTDFTTICIWRWIEAERKTWIFFLVTKHKSIFVWFGFSYWEHFQRLSLFVLRICQKKVSSRMQDAIKRKQEKIDSFRRVSLSLSNSNLYFYTGKMCVPKDLQLLLDVIFFYFPAFYCISFSN